MLTLFDRVMSSIYDDKIQIKFVPSQGINQDQINAYNTLAQSDYQEMGKARLDYDWCWDTLFFGRGYMETIRFNKKRKILQPKEELFKDGIMSPNVVDAAVLTMAVPDSTVRNNAIYKTRGGQFYDKMDTIYENG